MTNDNFESGFDAGFTKSKKKKSDQTDDQADGKVHGKKKKTGATSSGSSSGGNLWSILNYIPKLKHGGKVKKTGIAFLHRGETVIPAKHRSTKNAARKKTATKR